MTAPATGWSHTEQAPAYRARNRWFEYSASTGADFGHLTFYPVAELNEPRLSRLSPARGSPELSAGGSTRYRYPPGFLVLSELEARPAGFASAVSPFRIFLAAAPATSGDADGRIQGHRRVAAGFERIRSHWTRSASAQEPSMRNAPATG